MSPLEQQLRSIIREPGRIHPDEPLRKHTTFRIGGPADFLVEVADRGELSGVLALAQQQALPIYLLGRGSNLLVSDAGVRGIVLVLAGEFDQFAVDGTRVRAGGGYDLPKLATKVAKLGLGGLEFACAIPGTVGAGLMINAGAHGGDMSQVVTRATVVWPDGREEQLTRDEIGFAYRSSRLQATPAIVAEVEFDLHPADQDALNQHMKHHLERRRATQPLSQPNAGSVFKNPPGDYAGRLIEQAGLKGLTEGQAQISEKHANFIVNLGNATAKDVLVLLDRVRAVVQERYGVRLEAEVRIWGDNPYFPA
ncbi:MAG TPA: UDP-N-acetylmuramate dehydrogenase [Symbiobacteriaceae bacterium]|jgi:UDP-N-acetylmuramate dehydrogenase|nr:UDP-N-acetylmuramate dehydrogenase [Symbiobacteriaceae bacterium]